MDFLECPRCEKPAIKIWELFFILSPFWLRKRCRHCNEKLTFNNSTVNLFILCFIFGAIISNTILKFCNEYLDYLVFVLIFLFPIITGRRLFVCKKGSP